MDVVSVGRASLTERVAEEIRALLARRKMRQTQLARLMGVTDQWLSIRLRGIQPIDLNDLERMCAAMGVNVVDVVRAVADGSTLRYGRPHPVGPGRTSRTRRVGVRPRSGSPARNTSTGAASAYRVCGFIASATGAPQLYCGAGRTCAPYKS